jgi:hypothetical protein
MNQAVKEKAIQNNQDFCLKLADSIILASAQTCSIPLLTADIGFRKNIIQNQYDSTIRIIFAPIKPGTPLTQAHFAGSFFCPKFSWSSQNLHKIPTITCNCCWAGDCLFEMRTIRNTTLKT